MSDLNHEQITKARTEKMRYVAAFFLVMAMNLLFKLEKTWELEPESSILLLSQSAIIFLILLFFFVSTWRLCRSIQVSKTISVLNLVLSIIPLVNLIQAMILLNLYVKRTGIKLTFTLMDKLPTAISQDEKCN